MRQYSTSNLSKWTESIWLRGMTKEDYDFFTETVLMEDQMDGGGVLYRGTLTAGDDDPVEVILCTESDHPTLAMFGWIVEAYGENGGILFFDLRFFELYVIPRAREVGIWDVDRESYGRDFPEHDWNRHWSIMDAISRAWPYPTDPEEV